MTDQELSRLAVRLHREWDSPSLWRRIEAGIQPAPAARPVHRWPMALAMAASILLAVVLCQPLLRRPAPPSALLTEEALREVQQAETVYARSIEKLSAIAAPSLDSSPAPLAAAYREKLDLIDSAIADLKHTAETNRYNVYVETQLASLYRDKQNTLQDWLQHASNN